MTGHVGPGLEARDVSLALGGRPVLDAASLTVPRGAVTALVSPSGTGKSTILRCLNRLAEPDTGLVALDGRDIRTLDPLELRRRVGLVSQEATMLPGSVEDNLRYALPDPSAARVDDALGHAGLPTDFGGRDASALSGGERARVALARALTRGPEFLLLDEPTAALDEDTARHVGATLRRLADAGLGVCMAIHDLHLARTVADRVVDLHDRPVPSTDPAPR